MTKEDRVNDSSILIKLPEEDKKEFQNNTDNMTETLRRLIRSYNDVEEKYAVGDELEELNVILLRTYQNAIEQNIQVLQSQIDRLDEELKKYEEEVEDDEVLLEIDLDIASKNL